MVTDRNNTRNRLCGGRCFRIPFVSGITFVAGIAAGIALILNAVVIGIAQSDPLVFTELAPQIATVLRGFRDGQLIALGGSAGDGIVRARATTHIDICARHRNFNAVNRCADRRRRFHYRAVRSPPVGVQGGADSKRAVQGFDLGAADLGCIPAVKGIGAGCTVGIGRGISLIHRNANMGRLVQLVALNMVFQSAAVAIEFNICIVGRLGSAVNTVQIQLRLCQTALDQTVVGHIIGIAPQAESVKQIIAGGAGFQRVMQHTFRFLFPIRTTVVGQGHHSVKLLLGQRSTVCINESIHHGTEGIDMIAQALVRFFPGDAVFQIMLQFIRMADSTIAHGILLVIPNGSLNEPLELLDQFDQFFRCGHIRFCSGLGNGKRSHANQHHCRHQSTQKSLHHQRILLPEIVSDLYYNRGSVNLQAIFQNYYILVTVLCRKMFHISSYLSKNPQFSPKLFQNPM